MKRERRPPTKAARPTGTGLHIPHPAALLLLAGAAALLLLAWLCPWALVAWLAVALVVIVVAR